MRQHIGRRGDDFVGMVHADVFHFTILVPGVGFFDLGRRFRIVADGNRNAVAAEHAGNQRRRNADGADRHLLFIWDDKRLFHVGIDVAGSAFDSKVAEVFGRALSAGEDYRVKLVGVEFGQAFDFLLGSDMGNA